MFTFILLNCNLDNSNYIIDNATFKKSLNNGTLKNFIEEIKPFYKTSKRDYLNITSKDYNRFLTVIRQICNFNDIMLIKKVLYIKSKYVPFYLINKKQEEV